MKKIILGLVLVLSGLQAHAKGVTYYCHESGVGPAGRFETRSLDEDGNPQYMYFEKVNSRKGWLLQLEKESYYSRKGTLYNADPKVENGNKFYVGYYENGLNLRIGIKGRDLYCTNN